MSTPPVTLAELTALFRTLRDAIAATPEEVTKKDALFFLHQGEQLGRLARLALDPPPAAATTSEVDALEAAIAEATFLLHARFGAWLPPRIA